MNRIAVVGSINIDYVVETDQLPKLGETVLGNHYFLSLGGKGANQAVAASRLGGEVSLFASVGKDENSLIIKERLKTEKLNLSNLNYVEGIPTGVAFIEIYKGDNRILVVPGANSCTDISYIKKILTDLLTFDVVVFQLETPIDMLEYIVPILHEHGKKIILNPAPAKRLTEEIIEKVTYLTPNEHEYQMVLNQNGTMEDLLRKYPNKLIITCGSKGVRYFDGTDFILVPSIKVKPVDTTGAGDTFSGAFAVCISKGKSLYESIRYGNVAAGLSVTKKGAQTGMSYRNEVDNFLMKEEVNHDIKGQIKAN